MGASWWLLQSAAAGFGVELESGLAEWDHELLTGTQSVSLHDWSIAFGADGITVGVTEAVVVVEDCVVWARWSIAFLKVGI